MASADLEPRFDSIELAAMALRRPEWPTYLAFHDANLGALPERFELAGVAARPTDDGCHRAMRRIGDSRAGKLDLRDAGYAVRRYLRP
jgi:hypothetical protein